MLTEPQFISELWNNSWWSSIINIPFQPIPPQQDVQMLFEDGSIMLFEDGNIMLY